MNNIINKDKSEPYGEKTLKDGVITRPSSPRKFFERLYGNLECKDASEKEFSLPSSPNSSNNSMEGIHDPSSHAFSLYTSNPNNHNNNNILRNNNGFPTHFENLRDIIGLSGETPIFPPGLAAFLARRRRKEGRPRRQRTTFSSDQTLRLEVEFHRNEYISRGRRFELAETLQLSETQIKIWFQNRRAKDKRIEKAQIDQQYRNLAAANGIIAPSFIGAYQHYVPPSLFPSATQTVQQSFYEKNKLSLVTNSNNNNNSNKVVN